MTDEEAWNTIPLHVKEDLARRGLLFERGADLSESAHRWAKNIGEQQIFLQLLRAERLD